MVWWEVLVGLALGLAFAVLGYRGRLLAPMYHPAAALHQPRWRTLVEEDILKIPDLLAKLDDVQEEEPDIPDAQQLSLF